MVVHDQRPHCMFAGDRMERSDIMLENANCLVPNRKHVCSPPKIVSKQPIIVYLGETYESRPVATTTSYLLPLTAVCKLPRSKTTGRSRRRAWTA